MALELAEGPIMVRDFQEVQYLMWWAALVLFTIGVVVPIILVAASRYIRRVGPDTGAGALRNLVPTLLFGGVATIVALLSGWIFICFGVMATDVTPSGVRVQFGWLPGYQETVPMSEIQSVKAVRYNPSEYGGWGIKGRSDNDRILSQRGNRAVQLQLPGGRQLLIGSQQPEALAKAIDQFRP